MPPVDFAKIDAARAIPACRLAVQSKPGEARLHYELGRAFDKAKKYDKAMEAYKAAAAKGSAAAMAGVGILYQHGDGVAKDLHTAGDWYERATQTDSKFWPAFDALGRLYEGAFMDVDSDAFHHGTGNAASQKQLQEAIRLYKHAVKGNYAPALVGLGFSYELGRGVPEDHRIAASYYKRAADLGSTVGKYDLGVAYLNGWTGKVDVNEALGLFRDAAAQGYADAMSELGSMYENGRGVPRDHSEAAQWMEKALRSGSSYARSQMTEHFHEWSRPFRIAFQRRLQAGGVYHGPLDASSSASLRAAVGDIFNKH